jgi:Transposase
MVGLGTPTSRQGRRGWWRRQIRRQTEGSLAVVEFCRRLGVSAVTFHAWKGRFRDSRPASSLVPGVPPTRSTREANGTSTSAFLQVSIHGACAAGQREIELANARIVRLKRTVDPRLLRIAIHAVARRRRRERRRAQAQGHNRSS